LSDMEEESKWTNPKDSDSDDDWLTDWKEVAWWTNPNSSDSDGDWVDDKNDWTPNGSTQKANRQKDQSSIQPILNNSSGNNRKEEKNVIDTKSSESHDVVIHDAQESDLQTKPNAFDNDFNDTNELEVEIWTGSIEIDKDLEDENDEKVLQEVRLDQQSTDIHWGSLEEKKDINDIFRSLFHPFVWVIIFVFLVFILYFIKGVIFSNKNR
jgi:hypothetical protein